MPSYRGLRHDDQAPLDDEGFGPFTAARSPGPSTALSAGSRGGVKPKRLRALRLLVGMQLATGVLLFILGACCSQRHSCSVGVSAAVVSVIASVLGVGVGLSFPSRRWLSMTYSLLSLLAVVLLTVTFIFSIEGNASAAGPPVTAAPIASTTTAQTSPTTTTSTTTNPTTTTTTNTTTPPTTTPTTPPIITTTTNPTETTTTTTPPSTKTATPPPAAAAPGAPSGRRRREAQTTVVPVPVNGTEGNSNTTASTVQTPAGPTVPDTKKADKKTKKAETGNGTSTAAAITAAAITAAAKASTTVAPVPAPVTPAPAPSGDTLIIFIAFFSLYEAVLFVASAAVIMEYWRTSWLLATAAGANPGPVSMHNNRVTMQTTFSNPAANPAAAASDSQHNHNTQNEGGGDAAVIGHVNDLVVFN